MPKMKTSKTAQAADAEPSGDGDQPGGNGLVAPATEPATTQPA
jgi:hypothetical protein